MKMLAVLFTASLAFLVMPAMAAVTPSDMVAPFAEAHDYKAKDLTAPVNGADCTFLMVAPVQASFVPAKSNCHPALSDAAGICLALDPTTIRQGAAQVLPKTGLRCAPLPRPAPPG